MFKIILYTNIFVSLLVVIIGSICYGSAVTIDGASMGEDSTVDYSNPKRTYDTYLRAIKANDLETAKACWYFDDNDPKGALDVIVGLDVTSYRLNEVVKGKLSKKSWNTLHEWNNRIFRIDCTNEAIDRTIERLKQATFEINGDTAKLYIKWSNGEPFENPVFGFSGDQPIAHFRIVNGKWKIDANMQTDLEQSEELFKEGTWGPLFHYQVKVNYQIIAGLENGKLKTTEEIIEAYKAAKRHMKQPKPETMNSGEPGISTN